MPKQPFELETQSFAALPVVNHFLHRLQLEEIIFRFLPASGRPPKLGDTRVIGILLRNLVLARVPLYGVAEWAADFAPELLGLDAKQVGLLNDDRVGRALDRLFDADRAATLTAFVVRMIREFSLDMKEFHNDSTSLTLHGKYDKATGALVRGKPTIVATYGHNKDHRPDLKQLVWILTVSEDGAVPVHFKVADGNTEDSGTHIETWRALCSLVGSAQFLYVADCKLCTRENLATIDAGGSLFITIMPRTRSEDALFKEWLQDHQPAWQVVRKGAPYEPDGRPEVIVAVESPIPDSDGYRLIWYKSSAKMERDAEVRKGVIHKAWTALLELDAKLATPRSRYRTKAALAKAVEAILAPSGAGRWIEFSITETQEESFRQESRGRPTQTTRWRRTTKPRLHLHLVMNEAQVIRDRNCDGIFPLLTNDRKASLREVLDAYKSNQPFVEKRHHYLKTIQRAVPVMLKSISRIEALLFLEFLALTVRALIERELRLKMAAHGRRALPLYPEERECKAPTAERIFEALDGLQRSRLYAGSVEVQEFPPKLNKLQKEMVKLLGVSASAFK
jgi:transposase